MKASVRQSDRVIQQVGDSIGAMEGCDIVTLDKQQEQQFPSLCATPNGGIVLGSDGTLSALPVAAVALVPDPAFDAAVSQLRSTFNTTRTAAQMNNSLDAITVILRRAYQELK